MLAYQRAVFLVGCLSVVSAIGNDLKSILSTSNGLCESRQVTCQSNSGPSCCDRSLGVCCEHGKTCCPFGFSCEVGSDMCVSRYGRVPQLATSPPQLSESVAPLISANNGSCATKQCEASQTCCHDDWDCCPVPDAVCCKDKGHCCPHGYICDDQPYICRWPDDGRAVQTISFERQERVEDVKCDEDYSCPAGNTCCRTPAGSWGCCTVPDAVCCNDHIHCCGAGSSCDETHSRCIPDLGKPYPWLLKRIARKEEAVKCDSTHYCPVGNTCCKVSSHLWGCCPVPNAVCCNDHQHCCPSGYTCQTGTGQCSQDLTSIPWMEKKSAIVKSTSVEEVQCDMMHYCPSGDTCCRLSGGQWGCCPVPSAVCCDDHRHCCPSGYTCQSGTGQCSRGMTSIPWMEKKSPIVKSIPVEDVQCDATHYCPSGSTCCKLSGGQWGCCPVPNAVCCNDHVHCCPSGYTCQTGTGECSRGLTSIPWMEKESPIVKSTPVEDVQCDATHYCPSGSTCCKLSGGQWGCCPVPNAVCCNDHVHCCPSGYTCQTGTGECSRGLTSIPWMEKESPLVKSTPVEDVQCDATHYCPSGSTCCKLSGGQWGCCPVPNAVCCNDHVHCCPSGYTCQTGTGECSRGLASIPWMEKESPLVKSTPVEDVPCDATHYCPSGSTCCKLSGGQWGCCPVPNAVCCNDHVHCCPSGYTCQTGTGECSRGLTSIPWMEKESPLVKSTPVEDVQCDATHYCPSGSTCCKLSGGQWGCCPVPNAVCCNDHVHCCPSGYTCQTGTGECSRGLTSIPWMEKESPLVKSTPVEDVQCDATHYCPSGSTCCKLSGGQWGCCPVPNAVCCNDHVHCCPSGYTCQTGTGECSRGLASIPWMEKESPLVKSTPVEDVPCDATHYCPSGSTCCKLSGGQWGCCPVPNAVCCNDHVHCCPSGYTCQTGTGECSRGLTSIPWMEKESPLVKSTPVEDVQCDATHYCPSGSTCCKLSGGQWGCCPVPNAVCCNDHVHCCPSGYTCQTGTGECSRGLKSIPWMEKDSPLVKSTSVKDVQCDATHYCPSGSTCCKLSGGQWGCCPVPNAVCCNDHVHCCPSGYTCQTGTGECSRGLTSIPWMDKESPLVKSTPVEDVQCDATHYCPSGSTCCKLSGGQWGCCPVPNAVCCNDHVHCCPSGYTCQTGTGECSRGLTSIPWMEKESPLVKSTPVEDVQCDATHYCPSGSTCCKLSGGQWGCCPVPNAVCCNDHVHCCPSGYTCQTGTGECSRGLTSIPWMEKESPLVKSTPVEDVQCDATHYCPSGSTCCKLSGGQWGCCPVPNAVCCNDHVHCCPSGYTCQTGTGECSRGLTSIPWMEKESPLVKSTPVEDVQCDATHYCPSGSTCCKLSGGQWGCCPVPNAVCCNDHVHCCPSGYTCQTGTGECSRGLTSIPWMDKESPLVKSTPVEDVQCDATHYCPSGSTCCKLSGGQWGCCPVPNAVCCNDHVHCCPSGYTCQTGTGECSRGLTSIPWMDKESPLVKSTPVEDVQCDATHYCPSGSTCCKLSGGQWGCCPVPNAVCCNDHVHCCPSGYTCHTGTGECSRGLKSIPWMEKESPIVKSTPVEDVPCDATHYCPSGSTCCKLSGGQWGCCPVPNAVCCNDHVHCCPSGYTCQTGTGECSRGLTSIPWMEKESPLVKSTPVEDVQCDATHYCPSGSTCCKLSGGQWGCCPVPNAVCCNDHVHCCPSGYTCQTGTGECSRGLTTIPWMNTETAVAKSFSINSVPCDDKHSCPDGRTCCKSESGLWGCCPLPDAVCCDDLKHCCPSGWTCHPESGHCTSGMFKNSH
ncbi:uncharacterized protein K04H4.2-like isoform X2 [Watersipora subatra]|uniref:uncharacterized protein K04H4.2-like isoform X2 n=1 Tax=Watersipora subatra TaxID=2589382 RepID=UPI00355B675A